MEPTGVGTIRYIDVTIDSVTTRTTYGILDVISGRFDKEKFLAPYKQLIKTYDDEDETRRHTAELQRKAIKIRSLTPEVESAIDALIVENSHIIEQYKSGKEKAINVIVGKL